MTKKELLKKFNEKYDYYSEEFRDRNFLSNDYLLEVTYKMGYYSGLIERLKIEIKEQEGN